MILFEKYKTKNLILASKSPRRQELLKGLGLKFEIKTKDTDESYNSNLSPSEICSYLAEKKALAFKDEVFENDVVITSDTIVSLNGEILEKPLNKEEAVKMLLKLSGNQHSVFTGVCLYSTQTKTVFFDETKVFFKSLTREEIEYYVDNFKPFDKAGSYGIQEWIGYIGIEKIEGDYFNVMGLPLNKLYDKLSSFLLN